MPLSVHRHLKRHTEIDDEGFLPVAVEDDILQTHGAVANSLGMDVLHRGGMRQQQGTTVGSTVETSGVTVEFADFFGCKCRHVAPGKYNGESGVILGRTAG